MITIEDLKENLRRHLGALIDVYEAGLASTARDSGGEADTSAAPTSPTGPGMHEAALGGVDATRADTIETCLKEFQAAILAAEAAESVRLHVQEVAVVLSSRAESARRVAAAIQADALRLRAAFGDDGPRGELDLRRLAEARAAARLGEMVCARAESETRNARERHERVAAAALSALLAAARADPGRGNRALDPVYARAACAAAEQAAAEARRLGACSVESDAIGEPPSDIPLARTRDP